MNMERIAEITPVSRMKHRMYSAKGMVWSLVGRHGSSRQGLTTLSGTYNDISSGPVDTFIYKLLEQRNNRNPASGV